MGLCSKEIAFVWLILFGTWSFALRSRDLPAAPAAQATRRRGQWIVLVGSLLALGIYLTLRHLTPPSPLAPVPPPPDLPSKWLLMLRALGDYGRLMVFPDRLFMERQVFAAPGLANPAEPSFYNALAVTGGLVLVAFAAGAILPGRGQLLRRCGAGWFLVGFLPVSNLFSLNASVAEHWLYLPSIGFLLFLAGVALDLPWSRLLTTVRVPRLVTAVLLSAVVALGVRTWFRAYDWMDSLTFYRQTIRDGGDVPRAREGLALAYREKGDLSAALALLGDLAARYPHAFSARVNFAMTLLRTNRIDEGRADLSRVAADLLDANDDRRAGPREFATTIRTLDRLEPPADPAWTERRRKLLARATSRYPESWELLQIRIADFEAVLDQAGALALATGYADAHWWHASARVAVGRLLAASGRNDEALAAWQEAARLDVHDPDALSASAHVCLEQGRSQQALAFQEKAVRRKPGSLRQRLLLAQIFESMGQGADAARERAVAKRLARSDND